jgi:hypothetical protein
MADEWTKREEDGPYGHWYMTLIEPVKALWRWLVAKLGGIPGA